MAEEERGEGVTQSRATHRLDGGKASIAGQQEPERRGTTTISVVAVLEPKAPSV
jgi:hypothetical protein